MFYFIKSFTNLAIYARISGPASAEIRRSSAGCLTRATVQAWAVITRVSVHLTVGA